MLEHMAHLYTYEGLALLTYRYYYPGYVPGSCDALCNEHTYECYIKEIRESCCDERGASSIHVHI